MSGEQIGDLSERRTPHGLHLIPCAVVAGVDAPRYDDRLQGAQSALNRIQVWLGDILIQLRRRRQVRSKEVSAARSEPCIKEEGPALPQGLP
jgi:hypothetical protein